MMECSARISLSFVTCMINNCTRIHIFFLEPPASDFDGIFVLYCRGVVHTSFRMATWGSCWERGVKDSNCQHNEKVQDFLWLKRLDFNIHVFSNSQPPPLENWRMLQIKDTFYHSSPSWSPRVHTGRLDLHVRSHPVEGTGTRHNNPSQNL